jgi:hypothetical protein
VITHWVSQVEKWNFLPTGAATYLGPQPQTERPFGLCVSSTELTEGTVRFSVFIPTPHLSSEGPSAALVLGYASLNDHYYAIGIGGHDLKYTLVNYEPAAGWRLLKGAGSAYDLKRHANSCFLCASRHRRLGSTMRGTLFLNTLYRTRLPTEAEWG